MPNEELDSDYLYHVLRFLRPLAEQFASGTTFAELSGSNAARLPIAYPPIEKQRTIACILDRATQSSRSASVHLLVARRAIERFRQSVLAAACSGRLTADWRESNPQSTPAESIVRSIEQDRRSRLGLRYRLPAVPQTEGDIPESWCWTTVGALVDVATGATPLRKRNDYYGGSIPWVTSAAVNAGLITASVEYITELAIKETNAKVFPAGSLLVAMYGEGQTRGRVAELGIGAATNQALAALLFDDESEALRPYLRLFFLENYERIRQLSFGGVQPNLSLRAIRDTALPLPPADEQAEIVRRVDHLLARAEGVRRRIDGTSRSIDHSSQAVLAKAFRGDLLPVERATNR